MKLTIELLALTFAILAFAAFVAAYFAEIVQKLLFG